MHVLCIESGTGRDLPRFADICVRYVAAGKERQTHPVLLCNGEKVFLGEQHFEQLGTLWVSQAFLLTRWSAVSLWQRYDWK